MRRQTATASRRLRPLRRIAVVWLVVVGITGVLGVVQAAAAARAHACCPPASAEAQAPATPCPSLLPLACCDATVLPAAAPDMPERGGLALAIPSAAPALAPAAGASGGHPDAGSSPRVSPLSLSVVLRL